MIVYHGSIKKFEHFTEKTTIPQLPNDIDTIGFWFTSEIKVAQPFAYGTETVIEKSNTEFWDDREPKVVQNDRPVHGFIYRVFIDEPNLKEYESYESFMRDRDQYCDYFTTKKRNLTWKDQATLLNKEEANDKFRKQLLKQRYEGFTVQNMQLQSDSTDLFCIFSQEGLFIADVVSVDELPDK